MMKRTRVELVGLFPTLFSTRCKAVCDPAGIAGLVDQEAQLLDYPEEVRKNLAVASRVLAFLLQQPALEVKIVDLLSPRGLWLSLRHRLHRGVWAVVKGRAVEIGEDLAELRQALQWARVQQLYEQGLESAGLSSCGC